MLDYALADRLGMTVAQLRAALPEHEREGWIAYMGHLARKTKG